MRFLRKMRSREVALILAMAILLDIVAYNERYLFEKIHEDMILAASPSADLAFEYGVRHFDANDPREYDVDRAQMLFLKASNLDRNHPYVYHELGRIAFLKGNFDEALGLLNQEFTSNKTPDPSSYYVRALIKAYKKDYLGAAADYEAYFKITPANWGAINDYSWVLMKANLPELAVPALDWGLGQWPRNPWLLNSKSIALYELKRYKEAYEVALKAQDSISKLTERDWFIAYPGNDPKIAPAGLASFKTSAQENFDKIQKAMQSDK